MKKISLFFLVYSSLLIAIQSFLLFTTKTILFPEMYFFPWLVSKGLIPYRDFFDHHGFLTYYILSPFVSNGYIENLKFVYITIFAINLSIFLLILKKTSSKLGIFLGGVLYVLINFYIGENILWYESFITTLFLLGYYFLILDNKKIYLYLSGIAIGLATIIKPTYAVVLVPLFLYKRKKEIIYGWLGIIFSAGIFLLINNAHGQFLDGVFKYNNFLYYYFHPSNTISWKFWTPFGIVVLASIIYLYKKKKINHLLLASVFLIGSVLSLKTGLGGERVILPTTFFVLLIAQAIPYGKKTIGKIFVIVVLLYICILGAKSIGRYYDYKNTRIPWQEEKTTQKIIDYLSKKMNQETVYIFSNHGEQYIQYDSIPKTYYPLFFPGFKEYFPNLEENMINELNQNHIEFVIIPKKSDNEQLQMKKVQEFIMKNYKKNEETELYTLFKKD